MRRWKLLFTVITMVVLVYGCANENERAETENRLDVPTEEADNVDQYSQSAIMLTEVLSENETDSTEQTSQPEQVFDESLYENIDTYNMKIYLYDSICEEGNDLILTDITDIRAEISNVLESGDSVLLSKQLELLIKRNEFEDFLFEPEEKVICVYEGTIQFDTVNDKFALYKETAKKDILFVNMLFIPKKTGDIYTWRGEELVQIGAMETVTLESTDSLESEIDNNLLYENITEDELLDKTMGMLNQIGYNKLNLIYDGTIEFLNKSYYMISAFDDFEDHIIRTQGYYIDSKNGQIYRVEENADDLRTELYCIGDLW